MEKRLDSFASYHILERSYVAYLKREIHNQINSCGRFAESQRAEIDIVVSEICSNLVKHAGGGEILYRIQKCSDNDAVFEILSIDKGPGMADPARMIKDGVSTTSTMGSGLGAINRLSSLFQLYSIPGWGTVLYSKVQSKQDVKVRSTSLELDINAICINKPRETVCGDGVRIKRTQSEVIIFFGDGLGHGPKAKEAVDCAGDFLFQTDEVDPVSLLRAMHDACKKTRGLVATIAVCNLNYKEWRICGVGNVLSRMYHGIQVKNYLSYNGAVGLNLPNSMKSSTFAVERNQQLIMCSDGIQTRWELSKYPAISKFDSAVLAACIYKDFSRGNDDSSILVAKVG